MASISVGLSSCGGESATEGIVYEISEDGTYATVTRYKGSATKVIIADTYKGAL